VLFHVAPAGATVTVDGAAKGNAPLPGSLELTAGPHKIDIAAAGHTPWSGQIEVVAGTELLVVASLNMLPPPPPKPVVSFGWDPEELTVTVDGKEIPFEKDKPVEVEPGKHELVLKKEGSKAYKTTLELAAGGSREFLKWEDEREDDGLGPWVTMGLGVGLGVLGAVFQSEKTGSEGGPPGDTINTDEDRQTAAIVLYSVGGALVATGIGLLVYSATQEDEEEAEAEPTAGLAPYLSPEGGGVAAVLRF